MHTLCCHTPQSSQPMKARLSLGLLLPQMQRISSSSSSSSSSSACCGSMLFLGGLDLAVLVGLGAGAGEEEAFLCWPFVARPERRGSSVMPC